MFPKIVGFHKKWSNFEFIATANLYLKVLKEVALLSLLVEIDGLIIYQPEEAVKEVYNNLDNLCNDVQIMIIYILMLKKLKIMLMMMQIGYNTIGYE